MLVAVRDGLTVRVAVLAAVAEAGALLLALAVRVVLTQREGVKLPVRVFPPPPPSRPPPMPGEGLG